MRAAGDRAFLLAPDRPDRVRYLVDRLTGQPPEGLTDVLPAAETVLVTLDSEAAARRSRPGLERLMAAVDAADPRDVSRGTSAESSEPVRIPVRYDGPDLDEVARELALPVDEVIAAHTGTTWYCAFVGFAPGFGYLTAPDARLRVGRRASARTRIPAGSVALAGGYSAVYPRETPGGWQLIGRTDLSMWDTGRDPPALIRAGTRVRFVNAETVR